MVKAFYSHLIDSLSASTSDAPMRTFLSTLEAMKAVNPNPDFILWTGDSVPHWLDYTSVEIYDEVSTLYVFFISSKILHRMFTFQRPDPNLVHLVHAGAEGKLLICFYVGYGSVWNFTCGGCASRSVP